MGKLTIHGLTKKFNVGNEELVAVDDLSIDLVDGDFLVLVGPSGCGKSTTLRCVAGLDNPTDGNILLDEVDITTTNPKERDMAMVFQNYALYPHMTARENMSFGLKMGTNLTKDKISERVNKTSRMMGIESLLEKKPGDLSGGQQQRVALGRAIVRNPEIFLMDEPLSNLDAKLRTQMRTELQELQQDLGVTTIYVTHDQTEAMTMGDKIAVLNHGELNQLGTPLELYHEPANRFVAGFIGSPSMNFLTVLIDNQKLIHDSFEYPLSNTIYDDINGMDEITLGIRPEDIELAMDTSEGEKTLSFPVRVVEPLGDSTYVYFDAGDEQMTASFEGEVPTKAGDTLRIQFPEERLYFFDVESGDAVRHGEHSSNGTDTIPETSFMSDNSGEYV